MSTLNLSDNIVNLRHKKKITQEELANFVGVTKASVSKWETKQSFPDIMLLPQLASFFDVTVDELLGYSPQLSREQIQKIYQKLASDFAKMPFEDVIQSSRQLAKKYYSCYRFLFQICVLWLNHFMLSGEHDRGLEILSGASDLCGHIICDCDDISLCNDAIILKACIDLQLGKPQEVIETLEEILSPYRFSNQSDSVLIQAYQLAGDTEKAAEFTQISMFLHILSLVGCASQYLTLHMDNPDICKNTIQRIENVIKAYNLEDLHPNTSSVFYYQAAVVYSAHNEASEAIKYLSLYASGVDFILTNDNLTLHGDEYFNLLDKWFQQLDLGNQAPRNKKIVFDGAIQALNNPVFSAIEKNDEFIKIKKSLIKKGENL